LISAHKGNSASLQWNVKRYRQNAAGPHHPSQKTLYQVCYHEFLPSSLTIASDVPPSQALQSSKVVCSRSRTWLKVFNTLVLGFILGKTGWMPGSYWEYRTHVS